MDENRSVHHRNNDFKPGQAALLKADFDNNTKTRKRKLEGFYDHQVEVIECLANNRIKVKKLNGEIIHVRTAQIRHFILSEDNQ